MMSMRWENRKGKQEVTPTTTTWRCLFGRRPVTAVEERQESKCNSGMKMIYTHIPQFQQDLPGEDLRASRLAGEPSVPARYDRRFFAQSIAHPSP